MAEKVDINELAHNIVQEMGEDGCPTWHSRDGVAYCNFCSAHIDKNCRARNTPHQDWCTWLKIESYYQEYRRVMGTL